MVGWVVVVVGFGVVGSGVVVVPVVVPVPVPVPEVVPPPLA